MRQNPRIEAQKAILTELFELEFDDEGYVGDFLPGDHDHWAPNFHYYQGIENFRHQVLIRLERLQREEEEWRQKRQEEQKP